MKEEIVEKEEERSCQREKLYIYLGDQLGFIKIWDFTDLLESLGVGKCARYIDTKPYFNPNRIETIDHYDYANEIRTSMNNLSTHHPQLEISDPVQEGILVRECKAHSQSINNISKIEFEDFQGIVTCSKDGTVLTFTQDLDVLGRIKCLN